MRQKMTKILASPSTMSLETYSFLYLLYISVVVNQTKNIISHRPILSFPPNM